MTPRNILILCASRKIFDNSFPDGDVSRVVDDEARTANEEIRNYYMNCSERALKMLDNAVMNRVQYLESLVIAKAINDVIMPKMNELPKKEARIWTKAILYPASDFVAENFNKHQPSEEEVSYERDALKTGHHDGPTC